MNAIQVLEIRKSLNLNQEEFGKLIGVSKNTVYNWENGSKIPESKITILNRVSKKNHNIETKEIITTTTQELVTTLPPISNVNVPYFDVDFAGGWNSEELFTTVRPSSIITAQEFSRSEFACNLVGNSISRRIPNRSVVGLKEIKDWQTYFPTNELYAIVMKNNLRTIKIVKRSKENKNNILLIPDPLPEHNKIEFDIEEVPMSFVKNFFQVVAWGYFERLVM
ncbi:helix-turn-helix transcriptional regulator [Elizabethkingia anophelis]|nr:helix-turn-helix transcriptional regulator [Elizabethkingia anophelis]